MGGGNGVVLVAVKVVHFVPALCTQKRIKWSQRKHAQNHHHYHHRFSPSSLSSPSSDRGGGGGEEDVLPPKRTSVIYGVDFLPQTTKPLADGGYARCGGDAE